MWFILLFFIPVHAHYYKKTTDQGKGMQHLFALLIQKRRISPELYCHFPCSSNQFNFTFFKMKKSKFNRVKYVMFSILFYSAFCNSFRMRIFGDVIKLRLCQYSICFTADLPYRKPYITRYSFCSMLNGFSIARLTARIFFFHYSLFCPL